MKLKTMTDDERRWQAVLSRDATADGQFVFAVITTGIFCRPSCRARHALRQNVRFYADAQAALAAGFRPCKRCRPDALSPQAARHEIVARACRLLSREPPLTLAALASTLAVSPFHLHRLFKSVTGVTPKAWQQAQRAQRLRTALAEGETVTDAVMNAGFSASSAFYRRADATLGMTARQYRSGGEAMSVRFAAGYCSLGVCLVAASERGICAILLGDSEDELTASLQRLFPRAQLQTGDTAFGEQVKEVIDRLETPTSALPLPLDLRGTAFQMRVWQALCEIPAGETRSYQQIAQAVGQPQAVRAVASACAANKLALIIPCHRVIRQDGALSGYRWGTARKAALLRREAQQEESCSISLPKPNPGTSR